VPAALVDWYKKLPFGRSPLLLLPLPCDSAAVDDGEADLVLLVDYSKCFNGQYCTGSGGSHTLASGGGSSF